MKEENSDLIAPVENERVAAMAETISTYGYVNDAIGRRTAVGNTGAAGRHGKYQELACVINVGYG